MHRYNSENLTPFKSKWQNTPTKLIRVPKIFEGEILAYAHRLDLGIKPNHSLVTVRLKEILNKINNQDSGYKLTWAKQLIQDIELLVKEVSDE